MNRLDITALLFDWGGVFQRTLDYTPRQELAGELGLSEPALEQAVFNSRPMRLASLGQISAQDAWQEVISLLNYSGTLQTFVLRFFAGDSVDSRLVTLVRFLRANGYKVGLLSNAPPGLAVAGGTAARWGMEGLFDCQVFSHQVGALKPDSRTFTAALDALQAQPSNTVFIDDAAENIKGAEAAGLNALLYRDTDSLLSDLRLLGVRVPPASSLPD